MGRERYLQKHIIFSRKTTLLQKTINQSTTTTRTVFKCCTSLTFMIRFEHIYNSIKFVNDCKPVKPRCLCDV